MTLLVYAYQISSHAAIRKHKSMCITTTPDENVGTNIKETIISLHKSEL